MKRTRRIEIVRYSRRVMLTDDAADADDGTRAEYAAAIGFLSIDAWGGAFRTGSADSHAAASQVGPGSVGWSVSDLLHRSSFELCVSDQLESFNARLNWRQESRHHADAVGAADNRFDSWI